ncbi:MAG TPA: dihydropteroate synthase [Candidatus Polarisedimenticolia bacterium]|nr:dihydropteroate synthase [Candidatus Polarisedimenticolia bacterium]
MAPAAGTVVLRIEGLEAAAVRALAQAARAAGGEAVPAPPRRHDQFLRAAGAPDPGRALVIRLPSPGREAFLASLRRRAPQAAAEIDSAMTAVERPAALPFLPIGRRTFLMGVLNVTPDSFSDGGCFTDVKTAVRHALRMASDGADILDIGGESTRPGAPPVGLRDELRRVVPVLEALQPALAHLPRGGPFVSIDTTKSEVARRAALLGATLVNDVSGMTRDPAMPAVVAEHGVLVVLQHTRGRPRTMQRGVRYRAVVPEVAAHLRATMAAARRAGVPPEHVLIDPGFGFGKRRPHNLALLRHLRALRSLGRPILVGASRKSFLRSDRDESPEARREAGLAAQALAVAGGADIIRVHDVREALRVARLCDAVLRGPSNR